MAPVLGLDALPMDAPIDVLIRNLRADYDLMGGYVTELRAALTACKSIGENENIEGEKR